MTILFFKELEEVIFNYSLTLISFAVFNFSILQFFNSPVSKTNVFYLLLSSSTSIYLLQFSILQFFTPSSKRHRHPDGHVALLAVAPCVVRNERDVDALVLLAHLAVEGVLP